MDYKRHILTLIAFIILSLSIDVNAGRVINDDVTITGETTTMDVLFNDPAYNTISTTQALSHQMGTGVVDGSVLSINVSPALFNISAQNLLFSDYSASSLDPAVKYVNCPAVSGATVTNLAVSENTYVMVDDSCAVIQQTTFPTPTQRRTYAFIGRLNHPNHVSISVAATLPDFSVDTNSQLYDLFDAVGAFNISGNVISPNGANLSINKSAGTAFRRSVGYATNHQDPNTVTTAGQTPVSFTKFTQTAQVVGPFTLVDPASYDLAGTVTTIPNATDATNQRIYLFGNGQVAIQYGQVVYASLANAIAAISTESFVINPTAADGGVLLAVLSCRKDAADISDPAQCTIQRAGRFDNTGVSVGSLATTTLQQAYNNSVTPQITTSVTNGSVDLKRGTALDTDNVLRIQNGAGTTTASITGDGTSTSVNRSTTGSINESVSSDAATTGANATVPSPSTPVVRLTNASLTSIDMIDGPTHGRVLTLINATGVTVNINNNTGGTAANRILTGTGAVLEWADESTIIVKYDPVELRWMISGGSGGGGSSTMQDAYNDSVSPHITTTTPLGAVTYKRGSASDTDKVLRIQNGAGDEVISISGMAINEGSTNDSTTTGSGATLTAPTSPIVRLTNASLVSIDMIPSPTNIGRNLTLVNATGASVSLNNDSGGTAANRILTGDGPLVMASNASVILKYDGTSSRWRVTAGVQAAGNATVDSFSGTGAQVAFVLSVTPATENNTDVYVSGIYQEKDTYSLSGTTLTFSEAPPVGTSNIEVKTYTALSIGTPSDATVTAAKIAPDAVTTDKILNGTIVTADLAASVLSPYYTKTEKDAQHYSAKYYRGGSAQTLGISGTWTKLNYNTKDWDDWGTICTASIDGASSDFTCTMPVAGTYRFTQNIYLDTSSNVTFIMSGYSNAGVSGVAGAQDRLQISYTKRMTASQTISPTLYYTTSAGSRTLYFDPNMSSFTIERIGN